MDIGVTVDVVAGSRAIVLVTHDDKSWSREFDLLAGDVDGLAADLEDRMNRDLEGEPVLAMLLRRRILEARMKVGGDG